MLQNNSNEVLTIVDAQNFNKKVISLGEERKVNPNKNIEAISLMQKSGYQSVMWLHNHNRTSDFSYDDLGCFYNEKVKALTIVTNKGKVAVLNKTKNYDITKFYSIIIQERDKYSNAIDHADDIAKAIVKRHNEYGVQWIR